MALASLQFKVKLDPGCGRNVESDVDLSSSAVIFHQGLNLLLKATQRALKKMPPSLLLERLAHNKFHKWQNSFLSLSFPLFLPFLVLAPPFHFQKEGEGERERESADV